ncbi:MAG: pantetheine-phosphate adenylyltransferase [Nanoarchaeota archaeon]
MSKIAIYPGSFDPITNGHLDIIKRAQKIFDTLIIAVGENPKKKYLFTLKERVDLIKKSVKNQNIEVEAFTGLMINYAKSKKAKAIVRGLRAVSDFDTEFQTALMNRKLCNDIESVFFMTRGMYSYLSASVVKEAAKLGADVKGMVPTIVEQKLKKKLGHK